MTFSEFCHQINYCNKCKKNFYQLVFESDQNKNYSSVHANRSGNHCIVLSPME